MVQPTTDSMGGAQENKYCQLGSLSNESSVEQFFMIRLLTDLGYNDAEIKTKESIEKLIIGAGRKKEPYRPDYVCFVRGKPRLVIDAKAVNEDIDKYIHQCSGYSLALNRKHRGTNPVKYFMLSNGKTTKVFDWQEEDPLITLDFNDFKESVSNFKKLRRLVSRDSLARETQEESVLGDDLFELVKPNPARLNEIFSACHNVIWKKQKLSPSEAFYRFSKLMFLKLEQDRRIKDRVHENKIPVSGVTFSVCWINDMKQWSENPFDAILFKRLREQLEVEIKEGRKKRIFAENEKLDLKPATIIEVVKILQHYNLHDIDEDLNGRLFETFLNATIRGKELGQYFTPRSVVKLMVGMANLQVGERHVDKCLDACCGTGGFLIESMSQMSKKIDLLPISLSNKKRLRKQLTAESLFGIDANAMIVKIARVNMYLHGDGGSRIYNTEALDKKITIESGEDSELNSDNSELKNKFQDSKFNIILTNPPFAMTYEKKKPDELEILKQYKIAHKDETSEDIRTSLKSSVLFLERYYDLLADGGKLLTVMDEAVLNTSDNAAYRRYIQNHFIVRAVISLPRNTFVRADSSVKTSILYLTKKAPDDATQPGIFMAVSNSVGHTDAGKDDPDSSDLGEILDNFRKFEQGVTAFG